MGKRRFGDIISLILIVLLVLIALGTIGAVALGIVGGSSKYVGTGDNAVILKIISPVKVSGTLAYFSVIRDGGGGEIVKVNVISENSNGASSTITLPVSIKEYETKEISFGISQGAAKISVIPIVRSPTGREITGKITSSTTNIVYS